MPVQMFLKLDGIAGESTDPRHKGEIDIQGWSWGLSEPTPSVPQPGVGTGKVSIHDIVIQKLVDLSTPELLLASAEGRRIATETIANQRPGVNGAEFLIIKLTDVTVLSVAIDAAASADEPAETVTLAFTKVEFDYSPTLANGGVGAQKSFS